MELLPSLAGLSLAPDGEDEALPEPTDQAPAPQAALQQDEVVLKKYSSADLYNDGLRRWKNTTSVRDRWNQGDKVGVDMFAADAPLETSRPRAYFEDDKDFYEDWMQVSQQECFFYEYFKSAPDGKSSSVMHPIQHILRVIYTCLPQEEGVNSPDEMVKYSNGICIVDGSNMFDVGISQRPDKSWDDRSNVAGHWDDVIYEANKGGGKNMPEIVIGFVKAQTLNPDVNEAIRRQYQGGRSGVQVGGEYVPHTYQRLYQMLSKVGKRVFLVVVEDWESSTNQYRPILNSNGQPMYNKWNRPVLEKVCFEDPRALKQDLKRGEHKYCEFDDFLMMTLREYIDYVRSEPSTAGNGLLNQWFPKVTRNDKENTWFKQWRTKPTKGVVTFDKDMIFNANMKAHADAYFTFLRFSDVFRIRVFVPMKPSENLPAWLPSLMENYRTRYSDESDYVHHESKLPFYQNLRRVVENHPRQSENIPPSRNIDNEKVPVTWEYSLRPDRPCPPGWPLPGAKWTGRFLKMIKMLRLLGVSEVDTDGLWETHQRWNTGGDP